MGSKAYAVQWGQGSVFADSAESGDDEQYSGPGDEDEMDFRQEDFKLSEKEVVAESVHGTRLPLRREACILTLPEPVVSLITWRPRCSEEAAVPLGSPQ